MIFALTGHRPPRLNNEWDHNGPCSNFVSNQLQLLINNRDISTMISGMALGSDFIWAKLALKNQIPLIAAIPFTGQESKWQQNHIQEYHEILNNPLTTKNITSNGGYAYSKMMIRDRFMVDQCDALVAVYDNNPHGGTYKTIEYARTKNKEIIYINPNDFKL